MSGARSRTAAVLLLGLSLAAGGAGAGEEPVDRDPGVPVLADLDGSEWRLVGIEPGPGPGEGPDITLRIEDGRIAGRSGCNRYFASLESGEAPGEVSIGAAGATRMACPEPLMSREQRYLDALGRVTTLRLDGSQLVLQGAAGEPGATLRFAPAPP